MPINTEREDPKTFCNFRFGLRKKSWKIEFGGGGYSATSDFDLGEKVSKLNSGGGIL